MNTILKLIKINFNFNTVISFFESFFNRNFSLKPKLIFIEKTVLLDKTITEKRS